MFGSFHAPNVFYRPETLPVSFVQLRWPLGHDDAAPSPRSGPGIHIDYRKRLSGGAAVSGSRTSDSHRLGRFRDEMVRSLLYLLRIRGADAGARASNNRSRTIILPFSTQVHFSRCCCQGRTTGKALQVTLHTHALGPYRYRSLKTRRAPWPARPPQEPDRFRSAGSM